jgi:hypothetical protein
MLTILATWEAKIKRILIQGQARQIGQETKWTGGVAQVVEYLLCKCEALSSNSSLTPPLPKKRWWYIPVIPVLGKLRYKNLEFEANYISRTAQVYISRPHLK